MAKTKRIQKNKNKQRKTAQEKKIFPVGFYAFFGAIIIGLPLVYVSTALDPTLTPRMLGLSLILMVTAFVFLFVPATGKNSFYFVKNPLTIMLLIYAVITALSGFQAINFKEIFFDTNKSFLVWMLVIFSSVVMQQTQEWKEMLTRLVLVSASIALFIGFRQYLNDVILSNDVILPDGRSVRYLVDGLMAHKNQFAISLMLMLPFSGYAIYRFKGAWRFYAVLSTALLLLMLILLQTRSAWVGTMLAAAAMVVIMMFSKEHLKIPKKYRRLMIGITAAGALALGAIVISSNPDNPHSLTARLKSITNPQSQDNVYRLKIWDITLKMIGDHPVGGVGAGNWKINSGYYFKGYDFEKNQLNWIRPHNDFLWVFAEKGFPGFLVFLGIFVYAFLLVFKIIRSKQSMDTKVFVLFLCGGLVAYAAVSVFSFPLERMNHQVYVGVYFASILALNHQFKELLVPGRKSNPIIIPILALLTFFLIYSFSVLNAERTIKKARTQQFRNNWKQMLVLANRIPDTFRNIDADAMPVYWYPGLAHAQLGQPARALPYYEKAREAFPTKVMVLNNLGKTYIDLGRTDKGIEVLQQALDILPNYVEALINLSAAYYQKKDYPKALELLKKIPPNIHSDFTRKNMRALEKLIEKSGSKSN